MPFQEKPGTMWEILVERDGKPYQQLFLTAETAEDAKAQAQSIVPPGAMAVSVKATLYVVADANLKITQLMFVPK